MLTTIPTAPPLTPGQRLQLRLQARALMVSLKLPLGGADDDMPPPAAPALPVPAPMAA